ncbi:MAG: hypothetical protein AAFV53_17160 [Myxococcota bacterium]
MTDETDGARRRDALRNVNAYLDGAEALLPHAIRANALSVVFTPLRYPPLMGMMLCCMAIGTVGFGLLLMVMLPVAAALITGFILSLLSYLAVCALLSRFIIQHTDARERLEGELLSLEATLGEAEMEDLVLREDDVLLSSLPYPRLKAHLAALRAALETAD